MPTDGPSDRIYSYLCLRFRYFARQNADKFTLHAAFSAPLQEDSFTMKAGLRQIPIQGAAPRLAGNREWDGLPMPTRFWAILAVAFGVSLSVIDGAIANVALPTMARMLGISSANSIWIVNAYQLAIVVSLLSFSALGDVIGYRKIYIGGLGIFIVASLGCTLSDSLATLVTARVCQGFGAAAITSVNTTLIRLICGLQEPTGGSFTLYGVRNTDARICRSRRRMGAVVETPSAYTDMTAEENLRQQYLVLGMPSTEGIPELLRLVGLEGAGKKKVKHFSLGMRQRLGIAVALAGNPDLLVLDEPVNGLDPQGIIEIRELILKLNREHGITVLISSHILDELSRLATHYGFIDGGCMIKEISAQELESRCRKCIRASVSSTGALARVLDAMGAAYSIVDDSQADIYGEVQITALVEALGREGCTVYSVKEHDESLESFYMELVGGERHV
ncbi:MAG: MFS transporter [Alistipes sp.]|nr:MFS transporter [Alistipes sp.]